MLTAIKDWDISCLYLVADGPRLGHPGDVENCALARSVALEYAGNRPIKTWFRDENLGPGRGVTAAIDWFFENEEAGIILDDDCVPDLSFLPFCEELLLRYRDDSRVMLISGNNYLYETDVAENEYLFTHHPHLWGWATWKRAWRLNDFDMKDWPLLKQSSWLDSICNGHRDSVRYWTWIFDRTYRLKDATWDYPWFVAIWKHNGLSITPGRNLVTNIGFGERATYTPDRPVFLDRVKFGSMCFPLRHPSNVLADPSLQRWTDIHIFRTRNPWYRMMRLVGRLARRVGMESKLRRIYRWRTTTRRFQS